MKFFERLAEITEDWKCMIRRDGLKIALPAVVHEIALLPYRRLRFTIFSRSLTESFPDFQPKIALEIRPFQQSDLEAVREIDRPSEARQCARRLAHSHNGLTALYHGRPVGYAWGCSEVNPELERVLIQLGSGDILCTDAFTDPSFRGWGVQTALSLARFQMFRDLGYRRAICYIENGNLPSLAVWQKKLGGHIVGTIDFMRIGPWYRVRFNTNDSPREPVNRDVDSKI